MEIQYPNDILTTILHHSHFVITSSCSDGVRDDGIVPKRFRFKDLHKVFFSILEGVMYMSIK